MKELDSFTVERLEQLGSGAMFFTGDEVAALARIALAAKRAEESHSRREVWDGGNTWVQCSKQAYDRHEAAGKRVRVLYEHPQLNSPEIPDGWIKCSDHKPERGTDIQVYCSDTREQFVAFHIGNGEFQYAQHEDTSIACRPSHWMPLQTPPESE